MPLKLLRGLGFAFDADEHAAIYALWRFVGHLVGVPLELNPDGEAAAHRLLELRELTAGPPGQQSLELVRALLDSNLEPDGNDWLVARNERLIARGERTLKRRVAVAARAGRR